ncbi:MAG: SEC-C metal-binding domain-containing protein [Candidatus Zixiibacteriota bacterium]
MHLTGNPEKASGYYDEIYARGYNTGGYYPLYRQVLRMVNQIPEPRVLEIGCGVGDLAKILIENDIPYRGFDFSEKAVECAKNLCPTGNFIVGDAYERSCYHPEDYNIAIALEVLEHLDDFRVIENIPEGVELIASVPNYYDTAHLRLYQDPQRDIIERFRPYLKVSHVGILSPDKLVTSQSKVIYLFQGTRKQSTVKNETPHESKMGMVGRNELCPCGSGKKFKKCCLLNI